MSVAFFRHQPSGCFWYRIKKPMEALNAHGVITRSVSLNEDVVIDDIKYFQVYGIYPFSFDKTLKTLKADGKKIIYDLDDALDYIDPTNPFYFSVMKDAGSQREIFKYADHVTVATPKLAEYARTKTDAPITVIPNCFDPNEWMYPRPDRGGMRIGFAGSSTHVKDLLMVLPAIKALQEKHKFIFLIMGFSPYPYEQWLKDFRHVAPPEGRDCLDELERQLKDIQFEWVPFVEFKDYPTTLINMSLDIGLCPLEDSAFNMCRSSSKAMEYTLAGALALASDLPTYSQDPTSVLVKDGHWEEQIEFYITHPDIRKEVHKENLAWIRRNRNVNDKISLLKSVYEV